MRVGGGPTGVEDPRYVEWLLALVMWREARGEGLEGMRAVAHVIRNRVFMWHKGWIEVITAKNQFSSMASKGDGQLVMWPQDGDQDFEVAKRVARAVLTGLDQDLTKGAVYYENPQVATSAWFINNVRKRRPKVAEIGRHVFYA